MEGAAGIPTWLVWLTGVIGLLGGGAGVAALIRSRGENAKLKAEAAEIIQRTAVEMVQEYKGEVEKLKTRVGRLERQLRAWQKYAMTLWDFICKHGLDDAEELPCAPADEADEGG